MLWLAVWFVVGLVLGSQTTAVLIESRRREARHTGSRGKGS